MDQQVLSPLLSGLIPNRKGHPLVHRWFGVVFKNNAFHVIEELETVVRRTVLGVRTHANRGTAVDTKSLKTLLPEVVKKAIDHMSGLRKTFENNINKKLQNHLDALEDLKNKKKVYL